VRALLRRYTTQGAPELTLGRLRLDLPGHRAWVDDNPLELTAREFGLLEALAARPDRVTSRAQLIEALCSWDEELTDNGLDIAIYRLRRKLVDSGTQVRTIRGLGYLLEEVKEA
jgi:two-component system OmpR family response regulator